jgi:hypothetical protein
MPRPFIDIPEHLGTAVVAEVRRAHTRAAVAQAKANGTYTSDVEDKDNEDNVEPSHSFLGHTRVALH